MSLRVFREDGFGGVYEKDRGEAIKWEEENNIPFQKETLTLL